MTGWRMRRPPSIDEELARWTVDEAPDLRSLRAALQRAVARRADAADGEDLAERLTIVATELAGNALRHGCPPAVVLLQRAHGKLVIDVLDNDPASAPTEREQPAYGDGGLGLVLTQRLAQDVGWYRTGTGKAVWATFALARG